MWTRPAITGRHADRHDAGRHHRIHHAKRDGERGTKARPALISGVLFGLGLTASGMLDPAKVLGFLNITGAWVSDLIFVMGSAVVVTFLVTPLVTARETPLVASAFPYRASNSWTDV